MQFSSNSIANQRIIGITGGIATGKSTIAEFISKSKQIKIIDADLYTKDFLIQGSDSYEKIVGYFGEKILKISGSKQIINTQKLKEIIFNEPNEKKWIENLLHPLIKKRMRYECQIQKKSETLILLIPLLFEAQFEDLCTEIWLIKCSRTHQIKRLMKRDRITYREANKIIDIQSNSIKKEEKSQIIINSDGEMKLWQERINKLI